MMYTCDERLCIRKIMSRRKQYRQKEYVQFAIEAEDKELLDRWCAANSTTMSEVIKKAIAPYVVKGGELREQEVAP